VGECRQNFETYSGMQHPAYLIIVRLAGLTNLDHKSRGRNRFASAAWATAGPCQTCSLTKDIPTVMARGRLQHKAPGSITSEGPYDVEQMVFNIPFRDAEQGGEFIRRT
jgi:hypothetical protein